MDEIQLQQLATAWMRMQRAQADSEAYEAEFWSLELLWDLCRKEPDHAWKAICEIYRSRPEEIVLANLAAGPVEDLLVYHGDVALPWIARYCSDEPGFVSVLEMVWRNDMTESAWTGLQDLIRSRRR